MVIRMSKLNSDVRIGVCKHTLRKVLQVRDNASDDANDEEGWLCLHDETIEEEVINILNFKYKFPYEINLDL